MTKLEKLIKELCPNGVEYRIIGDVCNIRKGSQLNKDKLKDSGKYPVINGGINPSGYWDEYNFKSNLITISQGGASAGYVSFMTTPFWAGAHCYVVEQCEKCLNYIYLYHFIKMHQRTFMQSQYGAGIPSLSLKTINSTKIPVPPIEVQDEIVKILDNFTELTAELTVELTARQKQYEYYASNMFPSIKDTTYEWIELGDIATVTKLAGFEFTKYVTYSDDGEIIALRGLNVKNGHLVLDDVKYIDNSNLCMLNRSKLTVGDMLFTYVGTVGQVALIDKNDKYYLAPNVALIRISDERFLPKFMMYYFLTQKFRFEQIDKLLQNSSMQNLPMGKIRKFKLPALCLNDQQSIVDTLDRFDKLCNDISEGLPAEIEARQKQYEYYRDKLLKFKKKEAAEDE